MVILIFLNQFIDRVTFFENLEKEMFLPLIFYRLCYPSAMRYARMWYVGNIVRKFFDVDISSQRISEFLEEIGDESIQREFFKEYIREITPSEGVDVSTLKATVEELKKYGVSRILCHP
ncbi:MAG: hypothetical protein SCAL_001766 [Candidatus Syntrophoarchaeum caldarius]|uniref:Uncharacterized protein n=1 Tax=Candidatus Syntropharchaeum caldarium TaxID=1838285 RepID=A0A1F2P8W0_9EURY|nr:MAG: hypothetical protein SCAL_001766 [Candidatus Syntrophoarchaeum caldarius]